MKRKANIVATSTDVVELKVEERGEGWTVTRWVTKLQGKLFKWREKDEFDPPARISYKQIDGDLKKFEGDWVFEEAGGETRVTLTVDFEFGIPMIGALLNPVAKLKIRENSEKMLDGIKKKAER
ncbi:MAG: SRPBCC family protein [Actinobacteria bacterium]|nr:SRPBCC family protein [Actinomycetota bacterium]